MNLRQLKSRTVRACEAAKMWKREREQVSDEVQNMTMDQAGERISALLNEQRDLYRQLVRLADRQRGMITGNQPERLLGILAERQHLIDRLTAAGKQLKPYQVHWQQVRESLTEEQARGIDGLVGEVNALLAEILRKDEADTALLSARKSETGRALQMVKTGRRAGAAYAATGQQTTSMDWAQA